MAGNFSLFLFRCHSYKKRRLTLDIIHLRLLNSDHLHIPDMDGTIKLLKNTNCPKFNFLSLSQDSSCLCISFLMVTNYITLDLPRPHFVMVLIHNKPIINLNNYIVKFDIKKAHFPLLLQVRSRKHIMHKMSNKFDFRLRSAANLDYQTGKWL